MNLSGANHGMRVVAWSLTLMTLLVAGGTISVMPVFGLTPGDAIEAILVALGYAILLGVAVCMLRKRYFAAVMYSVLGLLAPCVLGMYTMLIVWSLHIAGIDLPLKFKKLPSSITVWMLLSIYFGICIAYAFLWREVLRFKAHRALSLKDVPYENRRNLRAG